MINEFSKTEVLIGAKRMNTLKNSTVAVLGVGGVGSHAVEVLARCGANHLIPADDDTVSLIDINRQSIALHSIIGQSKTRVMEEKIVDIYPDTQVTTSEEFVLLDNIESLLEHMELQAGQGNSVDYILDAIDAVTAKLVSVGSAASHGTPVIASMGTGNKPRPEPLRIPDTPWTSVCPLCKMMCKELRTRDISGLRVCWSLEQLFTPGQAAEDTGCRHATPGSISFVPFVTELVIVGAITGDICGPE